MPKRTAPTSSDPNGRYYWNALREHRLMLQHCGNCGCVPFPPRAFCPECWSDSLEWRAHSGEGKVSSFVWYTKSLDARFPEVPYNVSLIALAKGPVVISNVVEVAFGDLHIGDAVQAHFSDESESFTALLFVKTLGR